MIPDWAIPILERAGFAERGAGSQSYQHPFSQQVVNLWPNGLGGAYVWAGVNDSITDWRPIRSALELLTAIDQGEP